MDFSTLTRVPPELQNAATLLSGLLALSGLVLWSAGIKVARAISATLSGLIMAAICGLYLSGVSGLPGPICATIGLIAGLVLGSIAFRPMQGLALATTLSVLVAGGFYQLQNLPAVPRTAAAAPQAEAQIPGLPAVAAPSPDVVARAALHDVYQQWLAIPLSVRQQMLVLAAGVAIMAFTIAFCFPKQTTWVFTAVGGASMMLTGIFMILQQRAPATLDHLPPTLLTRLGVLGIVVLAGMLAQHAFFWPGKRQRQERARDHGHPIPA